MGRRRKATKVVSASRRPQLAKVFKCPFCAHDDACDVKLDKPTWTGTISCNVCGKSFQSPINCLTEPVDVYHEWLDELEAAHEEEFGDDAGYEAVGAS